MAEIISLVSGKDPTKLAPDERIVTLVQDILDMAEEGRIKAIVITAITNTNDVVDGMVLDPHTVSPYMFIGAMEAAKISLFDSLVEP